MKINYLWKYKKYFIGATAQFNVNDIAVVQLSVISEN